jgi:serine/threonine protein kinase
MTQFLGKYELLKELGRGGYSVVYLARDPYLQADVALKVIDRLDNTQRGISEETSHRMFSTEFTLVGRLTHPYIATLLDAGVIDGKGYVSLEYVPGGTLSQFCAPQRLLPVQAALEIAFKCTRALAYASQMGVIHRDIKPANILYCGGSNIKITDFGGAISERHNMPFLPGLGTPYYMAPERIEDVNPTSKSDMYALGIVLYELLLGRVPFRDNNTGALMHKIRHVEAVPPSAYRPELPGIIDELILRATAKDPAQRFATWDEYSMAISDIIEATRVRYDPKEFVETDKYGALRRCAFFDEFSDAMLWELIAFSHWSRFVRGDVIMRAGMEADEVCIVAQGELTAKLSGHQLNQIASGESFGEIAYVLGEAPRRAADIVARTDGILIKIGFDSLRQASPACRAAFNARFLFACADRLKTLTQTHFGRSDDDDERSVRI